MLAEIYGKSAGCSKGYGGSMHLIDLDVNFMGSSAIVANSIPIGTGLGLSASIRDTNQKSFIFFGDAAIEQGAFYESINFAAVRNLPTVFICENNLYSVYSSLKDRQPKKRKIFQMVKSIGLKSYSCDGNNVVSCYNTFKKALEFVKTKKKPVFLEFKTYRWLEHRGPNWDDNLGYRKKGELNRWIKKCPLKKIEKKLAKNNLTTIKNKIDDEVTDAFNFAKKSKFPKKNLLEKFY